MRRNAAILCTTCVAARKPVCQQNATGAPSGLVRRLERNSDLIFCSPFPGGKGPEGRSRSAASADGQVFVRPQPRPTQMLGNITVSRILIRKCCQMLSYPQAARAPQITKIPVFQRFSAIPASAPPRPFASNSHRPAYDLLSCLTPALHNRSPSPDGRRRRAAELARRSAERVRRRICLGETVLSSNATNGSSLRAARPMRVGS